MPRFTSPSGAQVDTADPDHIRRLTARGWTEDHKVPADPTPQTAPTPEWGAPDDGGVPAEDPHHNAQEG